MAYHCTRSRARSELDGSDVEPNDVASVAATSSPPGIIVRPSVAATGEPESVSTESAGPVSAPSHPLPAGSLPCSGGLGLLGPVGPPQVGVSALGYPSGLAGPSEVSVHSREQSSSSVGTTAVDTPPPSSSSLAAASYQQQVASRQPSTAATAKAAAEGLTLALIVDRPTRRIQSMSARTSSSFRSLSRPILSPAYGIEQSQSVPVSTGGAASLQRLASQRATSQRAPSFSPNQSTFSYGAPSPPVRLGHRSRLPCG